MDLKEQVDQLRQQIESSFDKRLKKLGLTESKGNIRDKVKLPKDRAEERERAESLIDIFKKEEGSYKQAREKYIEEFAFTLFNRIAALKVMGLKDLIPEPITRRHQHGNRSFAHDIWLEKNPEYRSRSREGIRQFLRDQFEEQAENIRLFSSDYPYDGLPEESDLLTIIEEFNEIDEEKWKSDDIMGWLYEYYNSSRKQELKDTDKDIEWDKVSLSSQIYTPRWVVEFLLNNSLGKLWLEMHPDSSLTENHLIANVPDEQTREVKPVKEIKLIDPACGSGNFLLYAYDLFKEMYREEGEIPEGEIPQAILENNLHGIDIDHRSVQIAQLSLYIKVMEDTRNGYSGEMNIVSTDFHLPDYDQARDYFTDLGLNSGMHEIVEDLWGDLKQARKFGSLIRVQEKLKEYKEEYTGGGRLGLFEGDFSKVIDNLHEAVSSYSTKNGFQTNFLKKQSDQGLQFLELLFDEYDVASANPPYTDSSNYGKQLKEFIEGNYHFKKDFSPNLYASFLKKNRDLTQSNGIIAMLNPMTFMYITKFEDMRKQILRDFHINVFVEFGLGGMFGHGRVMVDESIYVLEKTGQGNSVFIDVERYTRTPKEKYKKDFLFQALEAHRKGEQDKHLYQIDQEKLKIIEGWPFIYWISDDFRQKFTANSLKEFVDICSGLSTTNNLRFLRYWWELGKNHNEWIRYSKGGPWKKWFGNLWLTVNWKNDGRELKDNGANLRNREHYFEKGITISSSGSKGVTFRYLPKGSIFDDGARSIFSTTDFQNIYYLLGFLNSKLIFYINDSLNPTVNITVGNLRKIPFVKPDQRQEKVVTRLGKMNVRYTKKTLEHDPIEPIFQESPLCLKEEVSLSDRVLEYFKYENVKSAKVLVNEAIIDKIIFDVYALTEEDRKDVLGKQGKPAGQFPISDTDRRKFLDDNEQMDEVEEFVQDLPTLKLNEQELEEKRSNLLATYKDIGKGTEAVRELSEEFEVNPLTVYGWIEQSDVLPEKKVKDHAQKYVLVLAREVLMEDEDGIAPLVDFSGEVTLHDRIQNRLIQEKNFTQSDINELKDFLGYNLDRYIREYFFEDQSNILNKFMYQPKTPFIWHLSSGEASGFEVAAIIYKWNRDRLISIKNRYLEKRREAVKRQLNDLGDDESPEAQKKREKYRAQLEEIEEFEDKVIDLLESGYDPVLDDGVGYNIAPLQKRDMLKYDPLTSSQLDKFLNADWGSRAEGDEDA